VPAVGAPVRLRERVWGLPLPEHSAREAEPANA
jgi:hypothetical protein